MKQVYEKEIEELYRITKFDNQKWNILVEKTNATNSFDKGKSLEDLANYFFSSVKGIKITGRNIRYLTEEIDLCLCNYSKDSILWKRGSVVLVEWKNQKDKISVKTIRDLSCVMELKGIESPILITTSVLTKPALEEIKKLQETNKNIIVIYLEEIKNIEKPTEEILKEKIIENEM